MFKFDGLTMWTAQALTIDFIIIIALFVSLKQLKGWISNLHAGDEIAKRDNFAFGISFAAGLAGLAIVLTGVSSGDFADSLLEEAVQMAGYGVLAIALIKAGHFFQDKVTLQKVDLHAEIVKGNMTASFVEFGHIVTVAIVVRSAFIWVLTEGWHSIPVVIAAFVVANIIMLLISKYRVMLFKRTQHCLQDLIIADNHAVGLRYAGFLIGSGLAVTSATGLAPYMADNISISLFYWALYALLSVAIFAVLHLITLKVILFGVDIGDEVIDQGNVGVAMISATSAFAIGLTMATLLGS